jgi:RNA polymerase sigma-70 factor (ECF subfamily)
MNKFKFQSAFYTYLYRICINTCKTKLGIRYSLQRGTLLSLNKNNLPDHEIESNHPTPEKALGNKTLNEIFKKTISKLPSPDKEVLILRDIEGLSYTEISEITNLNLGTIKSKISRSRTKLKSLMEKWL